MVGGMTHTLPQSPSDNAAYVTLLLVPLLIVNPCLSINKESVFTYLSHFKFVRDKLIIGKLLRY